MDKQLLRKLYKEKRLSLTDELVNASLQSMSYHWEIFIQKLAKIHHVLSYQPMLEKGELSPIKFESVLRNAFPKIQIAYPRVNGQNMDAVVANNAAFNTHILGMKEIIGGEVLPPYSLDLVLVPLLCFDKRGYRVGYGKGFYDRYLTQVRPTCMTIGLSIFSNLPEDISINEFDIPMQYCLTPTGMMEFIRI